MSTVPEKEIVTKVAPFETKKSIFTGRLPVKTITVEVETGTGTLTYGDVVAAKDDTGKVTTYKLTGGTGGEEKARYILASETLDLAKDKYASVYDCGDFYYGGIQFPTGATKAQVEKAIKELREHKIYVTEGDSKCPEE